MAKAGNNRERAVAVAAAEEKDCGGKSHKQFLRESLSPPPGLLKNIGSQIHQNAI